MPIYTLFTLRSRVLDLLDQNTELYPASDVDREINDSIRAWNSFTGAIVSEKPVPGGSVPGQVLYPVPSGLLYPLRISVSGRELQRSWISAISRTRRSWVTERTPSRPWLWIPVGINKFAIWPAIETASITINVFGVAEPAKLVNDFDLIEFHDEDADAIVKLAAVNLLFREGGSVFAQASLMYRHYLGRLKERSRFRNIKLPRYWLLRKESADADL